MRAIPWRRERYHSPVPETPEQLYARAANDLRMPAVHEWETFPFAGVMQPRGLQPPAEREVPRQGEGGIDCNTCAIPDSEFLWTNERWRIRSTPQPTGMPVILLLEPRRHYAEPGDLPEEMAAELGVLLASTERAVRAVDGVGRVHVCRWGDGGEHLHWWFVARPARFPQLIGSFAAIWDDVLPPTPAEVWRDNLARITRELSGGSS